MIIFDTPRSAGIRNQIATARLLRESGAEVAFFSSHPPGKLVKGGPAFDLDAFALHWLAQQAEDTDGSALPAGADHDGGDAVANQLSRDNRNVFAALRKTYEQALRRTASFLSEVRPSAIVVSDDGIACNSILTTLAKRRGIPVLCCPYGNALAQELERSIELRIQAGEGYSIASPAGELVAKLHPKWVKTGSNAGSLMLRPEAILAKESAGATIERPWRIYGSEADMFCSPGAQYRDAIVAEGFDAGRVAVTGSATGVLIDRVLHTDQHAGAAFRQAKKLDPGRTRVLIAFPPNYHASRGQFTEFPEGFARLLDEVTRPLRDRSDIHLTVSAHPATTTADLACYEQLGIAVDQRYLLELIPHNDVFVTDFSSTVIWAIACGKPVVNYDFYGFALDSYAAATGVLSMSAHKEYKETLERLLDDESYFAAIAGRQIDVADYWCRIDAKFASELLALIEQLRP